MLIIRPPFKAKAATLAALAQFLTLAEARTQTAEPGGPSPSAPAEHPRTFDINEFRIEGASQLSSIEVESAVYPFLGPGRVLEDVERARAALEKAYTDKGYQSVSVIIPQQTVRNGVVVLKVREGMVGRLRVRGARYFSPRQVKELAPSVAEGR